MTTGRDTVERRPRSRGDRQEWHGRAEAERIVALAEEHLDLKTADWAAVKKSDWRKGLVGGLIRERALIDNGWLSERLQMGARNAVSRIIRNARELEKGDRKVKRVARELRKKFV